MGRYYGEQQSCFKSDPPRPDPEAVFNDDTGNAGKDGMTVKRRRPIGSLEIMELDRADEWDDMETKYPSSSIYGG